MAGVRRQAIAFVFGEFASNLASVAVKLLSHVIHYLKKNYKFHAFYEVCKDNATIHCITIKQKKAYSRQI